jgi:hypothetical protein
MLTDEADVRASGDPSGFLAQPINGPMSPRSGARFRKQVEPPRRCDPASDGPLSRSQRLRVLLSMAAHRMVRECPYRSHVTADAWAAWGAIPTSIAVQQPAAVVERGSDAPVGTSCRRKQSTIQASCQRPPQSRLGAVATSLVRKGPVLEAAVGAVEVAHSWDASRAGTTCCRLLATTRVPAIRRSSRFRSRTRDDRPVRSTTLRLRDR